MLEGVCLVLNEVPGVTDEGPEVISRFLGISWCLMAHSGGSLSH